MVFGPFGLQRSCTIHVRPVYRCLGVPPQKEITADPFAIARRVSVLVSLDLETPPMRREKTRIESEAE